MIVLRALSHIRVSAHLWPIVLKLGSGLLATTVRVTRPLLAGDSKVYILNRLYDRIRILAQPLWNGFLIVYES